MKVEGLSDLFIRHIMTRMFEFMFYISEFDV